MEFFTILVVLIFIFATLDLIVGVSNDAVNFLNSAVGSKVAPMRTILIIASLGILIGVTFSSGMMDIARKDIFNPGFFTFDKVIYIFLAVVLTDVILLDFYNFLGLPTSTTVSIVFELLGAAFVMGVLVVAEQGDENIAPWEFLNFSSAGNIIAWLFGSVAIAFVLGAFVQYITRLLFTYKLDQGLKYFGGIFGGLAITSIIYFLFMRGAAGSVFVSDDIVDWITDHTALILFINFVVWTAITHLLMLWFHFNPLKFIVLFGTFALALAFAGNDLVNFIGVAIAALAALDLWSATNIAADAYNMTALSTQIAPPAYILVLAGVVMVITLWFSRKARKVTETEVGLARQYEGDERFEPNPLARALVGGTIRFGNFLKPVLPRRVHVFIARRFYPSKQRKVAVSSDDPAFDLLRASVNLVMAASLISFATSKKLPLSTTYVSFMVAMGTSFADRAWRSSHAVYRVSGMIQVLAGWMLTPIIAFLGAAIVALVLYIAGGIGVAAMSGLAVFLLIKSQKKFSKTEREEKAARAQLQSQIQTQSETLQKSQEISSTTLRTIQKNTTLIKGGLIGRNRDVLRSIEAEIKNSLSLNERVQLRVIKSLKTPGSEAQTGLQGTRTLLLSLHTCSELLQVSKKLAALCRTHLSNYHPTPDRKFFDTWEEIDSRLDQSIMRILKSYGKPTSPAFDPATQRDNLLNLVNRHLDKELLRAQTQIENLRQIKLQIQILLYLRDMVVLVFRTALIHQNNGELQITHPDFLEE